MSRFKLFITGHSEKSEKSEKSNLKKHGNGHGLVNEHGIGKLDKTNYANSGTLLSTPGIVDKNNQIDQNYKKELNMSELKLRGEFSDAFTFEPGSDVFKKLDAKLKFSEECPGSDGNNNKSGISIQHATWNDGRRFKNMYENKSKKNSTPSKEQRIKILQVELDKKTDENVKLMEQIAILKDENERLKFDMKELRHNEIKKQKNRRLHGVTVESKPGQVDSFNNCIIHYSKSNDDKTFIKGIFKQNEFFSQLDKTQLKELVECCYIYEITTGEYLYKEGGLGEALFIIEEGVFQIEKGDKILGEISKNSITGEASVLYRCQRTASCKAISDECKVWCLQQDSFQNVMLKSHFKLKNEYVELLRNVPILSQLSESSLLSVINIVQELSFQKDDYIFKKGEIGNVFFIVKTGSVMIYKKLNKTSERSVLYKQLGRGSYFGEKALLNEERRPFDAKAGENGCVVLSIESDDFTILISEQDELQEVENLSNQHNRNNISACTPQSEYMKISENQKIHGHRRIKSLQDQSISFEISKIKLDDLKNIMTRMTDQFSRLDLVAYKGDNKQMFLLKQIKKRLVYDANIQDKIIYEKKLLNQSTSPFIVKLFKTFKDRKYLYMLFEPCLGGDMLTLLSNHGRLDDLSSKFYAGCVVEALSYLHKNNIIFRNFKTDNTFIDSNGYLKLAEFTNVKKLGIGSKAWTFIGEPEYIAPEIILNKGYDYGVDYWAFGIFIYELLMGNTPFRGNDPMKIYNMALKGLEHVVFPDFVNRVAALLIKKLCKVHPNERLGHQKGGWNDVRKHKWFDGFDWQKLIKRQLIPPYLPNILQNIDSLEDAPYFKDDEIPPDDNTGWDKDF